MACEFYLAKNIVFYSSYYKPRECKIRTNNLLFLKFNLGDLTLVLSSQPCLLLFFFLSCTRSMIADEIVLEFKEGPDFIEW